MSETTAMNATGGMNATCRVACRAAVMAAVMFVAVVAGLMATTTRVRAEPLESELKSLLDTYPKIHQAEKTLESRRASVDEAKASFLPRVNVTGGIGPQVVDSPAQRQANAQGDPWRGVKNVAGITVTQNLFNGFKTSSQVRSARINRQIAALSLQGTQQNTLFEGAKTYIDVLRQRRLVEMAQDNERTIRRRLNLEDERVRRGSGVTVDVLQAKSRLQIAMERRVGFEGALSNAISRYKQVFAHAPQLATMVDPAPPAEVIPSNLDRAIRIALRENPALIGGAATVEMARENRRTALSSLYPSVDLVGAANYERKNNTVVGIRRDYSVTMQASWDLYSGGSTVAQENIKNSDYRASQDNLNYLTTKVIEQTRLAWQSLITARKRKKLLGNAVNIASEVFTSRQKLRAAGKETVINVLDAKNELNNAQINYTRASYDERVSIYQLLLAMGRLMPDYRVSER